TTADVDAAAAAPQFRLLHGALASLARGDHAPRIALNSYILRALSTAGWAPSFTECSRCGREGPHRSVNISLGGVVCDDCRPSGSQTPAPESIRLLAALLAGDWAIADASEKIHQKEAAGIVERYLQFHVEKNLRSLSVMDQT
ncbi:MAG: DNA repair protein RecO, partial [Micrococcaceae bacterium]